MNHRGIDAGRPDAVPGMAYGIDGCSAGWFYFSPTRSGPARWGIVGTIEELVSASDDSDRIFVDIPIGLPNGPEGRLCDREARGRLGAYFAGSVFPAPVRAALAAVTYEHANRISRNESGKGMTQQTFAILPKIREVDSLLQNSERARRIVREVHLEICFWALRNLPTTLRHFTNQFSDPSFLAPSPSAGTSAPSTGLTARGRLIQTSAASSAARGGPATKRSGRAA